MKYIRFVMLTSIIAIAMASIGRADVDLLMLKSDTSERLMPLFNRLVFGQIISAVIIGLSAVVCCIIIKRKS